MAQKSKPDKNVKAFRNDWKVRVLLPKNLFDRKTKFAGKFVEWRFRCFLN